VAVHGRKHSRRLTFPRRTFIPVMNKSRILAAHVFAVALMSGVTIAMVTQVVLARYGIVMAGMWRNLFAANQAQMRSALAWWMIAGAAFIGGFAVAFVMSRFHWLYLRVLRGWLAAALVIALAGLARDIPAAEGVAIAGHVATSLAAMVVAAVMAGFGGYFALRR
jgi:glucan phosphoethanolaminetransferase (alkaline phosphatase superfamily)